MGRVYEAKGGILLYLNETLGHNVGRGVPKKTVRGAKRAF